MMRRSHLPQTRIAIRFRTAIVGGLAAIHLTLAFTAANNDRSPVASLGPTAPMSTVIGAP